MKYAGVIGKAQANYSAYVPDLPGGVATGATVAEVGDQIREAIEFHIDGMRQDGEATPSQVDQSSTSR
jgi:predicted RNase H-like HicB family nuclease